MRDLPCSGAAARGARHDRFRRDVGAGPRDRLGQPRPGLSRHRRADRGGRRRGRRHPGRGEPVLTRPRAARPAAGDRRAPATVLRPRARPGDRGRGDDRRHRGGRRRAARAGRPGRRGRGAGAVLRLLRRLHPDGRRGAGAGDPAGAGLPARPRPAARGGHRPDPADPAQQPAQPDWHRADGGRADRGRRPRRRAGPGRRDRRGLRAHDVRRGAPPAGHVPRHAGAHPHDQLGRQDLLLHRLEGRAGPPGRPTWCARC